MLCHQYHKKARKRRIIQNKQNRTDKQTHSELVNFISNRCTSQKMKTEPNQDEEVQRMKENYISPSTEFAKQQKPFLDNKKIIFTVRSNRQKSIGHTACLERVKDENKQTNIDKLKRQIQELENEDFISYRSKTNSYTDELKLIDNKRISQYNQENSLIVQLKGQTCFYKNMLNRPKSTVTNRNCSSVPHKYFSKIKKPAKDPEESEKSDIMSENLILNSSKFKFRAEQLAISHNMMRGKAKHKKNHSSYRLYDC